MWSSPHAKHVGDAVHDIIRAVPHQQAGFKGTPRQVRLEEAQQQQGLHLAARGADATACAQISDGRGLRAGWLIDGVFT